MYQISNRSVKLRALLAAAPLLIASQLAAQELAQGVSPVSGQVVAEAVAPQVSSESFQVSSVELQGADTTGPLVIEEQVFAASAQTEVAVEPVAAVPVNVDLEFAKAFADYLDTNKVLSADLKALYAQRDFFPIFAGTQQAVLLNLVVQLENADDHGLPTVRYQPAILENAWLHASTIGAQIDLELAALNAYLGFARDVTSGIIAPRSLSKEMATKPVVRSDATLLRALANAENKVAYFRDLGPTDPAYARLKAEKRRLEVLALTGGWGDQIPDGKSLRPGESSSRVVALRQRLDKFGYTSFDLESPAYDDALFAQVKQFQADSGLNADGVVGPKTLAALNGTAEHRLKQVIVNLERLRWTNFDFGKKHIEVNIPSFMANVYLNDEVILSTRVVTGTAKHQTAEFSDEMTHMIVNPTWHVPDSIASEEYLPQMWQDPSILRRQNIAMLVKGSGQIVDPEAIDMTLFTENNFPFLLKQRPSPNNALGRVKFMFPNGFNIYLHDTPAKSLFNRDARAYSHGCVRVQKPFELAYTLLGFQESDPVAKFESVLNTGRETRIDLYEHFKVHILYRTAFVDIDGSLQFREDVYGRDELVMQALRAEGLTMPDFNS